MVEQLVEIQKEQMGINHSKKKNTHNNYIAIAKAIGIMCVVIWHSRPPQWLGIFVMFFAVPLFFFTSGYFYKPSNKLDDLKTFYIKRIKGLYLPYIKWSLAFLLLHNICFQLNIYNSTYGYNRGGANSDIQTIYFSGFF